MVLDKLLSPIKIGKIEIPNRVALAPMGVSVHAPDDSWPKRTIRYFEERAIGGTGLIITSFTRVHNKIATGPAPLVGIYEDRLISSHAQLVERIHRHDSKIFIQISLFGAKFGGLQGPSEIYSLKVCPLPMVFSIFKRRFIMVHFYKFINELYILFNQLLTIFINNHFINLYFLILIYFSCIFYMNLILIHFK